jgi:hypothetical protein
VNRTWIFSLETEIWTPVGSFCSMQADMGLHRSSSAPLAEHFFIRLQTVLGWPAETTDRIRRNLIENGKALNVSLGSPSMEQLRRLGFVGLDS